MSEGQSPGQEDVVKNLDSSVAFVLVWSFFFPLFKNSVIAGYLEDTSPGFVMEMKNTFISIVMDGPFRQKIRADWLLDPALAEG